MSEIPQLRHIDEWHEDIGDVLWWHTGEAPYVGSPLCLGDEVVVVLSTINGIIGQIRRNIGGWPGYHKWWTPIPFGQEIMTALEAKKAKESE